MLRRPLQNTSTLRCIKSKEFQSASLFKNFTSRNFVHISNIAQRVYRHWRL